MARFCELISPLGDTLKFSHMRVSEGLSRLFEIQLETVSERHDIDPKSLLGKSVTVAVTYDDGQKRFFNGYVTQMSLGASRGRQYAYQLVLRPWLWFLTRTSDCRIFQDESVPDIIDKVFADEGATAVSYKLADRGHYKPWEYCVQYRETDFAFISRLLEQEGITYFFDHVEGQHTLVLVDGKEQYPQVTGDGTLPFVPASTRQSQDRDRVLTWDTQLGIEPGVFHTDDYDFKRPPAVLDVVRKAARPSGFTKADYEIYEWPGSFDTSAEGEAYAESRIEELHGRSIQHRGSGALRFLAPGRRFKLSNHPKKDQNSEYLVTGIDYEFSDSAWESGAREAPTFQCGFDAIPAAQQFRPARGTARPTIQGIQTAVVTGPAGEEIHTDKFGRIKVQFHWDRYGKKDDHSSCWMRVAFLAAGGRFGFVSIPRIGHEVVISFVEGDPDRPLVTGVVYNGSNMPPWELPANKTQSGLLTRSSKGGAYGNANAIRFEDKKGAEQVWIHAEKNQDIEVENDETHWVGHDRKKNIDHDETTVVGHDRTETVGNNETIGIGANRVETVGANETISIGANRTETVGANESVTIGANRTHTVHASETLTVALQRTATVGINETITVGAAQEVTVGAMQVISVGANQTTTVGANQSNTVGASQDEKIGASQSVEVGAAQSVKVGSDRSITIGGADGLSVGKSRTVSVADDDNLTVGKNLVINAGDSITIKTGSASITLKKDGTIMIKGKDITMDGSGKISVKAGGDIGMKGSKILQN